MPHTIFILWAVALLVFSMLAGHFFLLWQTKWSQNRVIETRKNTDGPPRFIFQALYLCILWALFVFWFPMLLTFQEKLMEQVGLLARFIIALKILFIPVLFLFLILLGKRRGYLHWIKQLPWPNDDY